MLSTVQGNGERDAKVSRTLGKFRALGSYSSSEGSRVLGKNHLVPGTLLSQAAANLSRAFSYWSAPRRPRRSPAPAGNLVLCPGGEIFGGALPFSGIAGL